MEELIMQNKFATATEYVLRVVVRGGGTRELKRAGTAPSRGSRQGQRAARERENEMLGILPKRGCTCPEGRENSQNKDAVHHW